LDSYYDLELNLSICSYDPEMKIDYPIEWNDRDQFERPRKGWLEGVVVTTEDGVRHELAFWDPVRLQQDLNEEVRQGKAGVIEKGLIVIPEVTKENIERAIHQAADEGYFKTSS